MNKDLIEMQLQGNDSTFGPYSGKYFYNPEGKAILKVECNFVFDTLGRKVLYYSKDHLIKAVDNKINYYYLNDSLINEFGIKENTNQIMNILVFQKNLMNLLKILVSN
ncbi:hypothetical protein OCK74_19650 [Chitinophagaceae bacterium LB-8]|uniref:Uncharacterized protein n=1 Tax=Paraflavisolibacter caeni TaxID=2982496 RepID=A0A9X3B9I5_9BACT|nr:hypothetical protein [Paraflavisolibacter caeni]MCU7551346.1 hypothetical protein [Paraflavisolibacter caeni]